MTHKVFVLNKSWTPLGIISHRRAFKLLVGEKADAILLPPEGQFELFSWEDWFALPKGGDMIQGCHGRTYRIPTAIRLSVYLGQPRDNQFTRRALFSRDGHRCQYCGRKGGNKILTIDHVLPKCRGGRTSFDNCVVACKDCNAQKGDRLPEEAVRPETGKIARFWRGPSPMRLANKPSRPAPISQLWEELLRGLPSSVETNY